MASQPSKVARHEASLVLAEFNGLRPDLAPEKTVEVTQKVFDALGRAARSEGVQTERWGPALFAVLGTSAPAPTDASQSIRLGFALQDAFGALEERWMREGISSVFLRVGVATGDVTFGDEGALGPTVAVVRALAFRAPPGGVLVSTPTRRAAAAAFEFQAMPGFAVTGVTDFLQPFLAIGPKLESDPERSAARLPSSAEVIVRTAAQAAPGRVDNVSGGGMYVSTVLALRVGTRVEVEMSPVPELTGATPVLVKGTVRHLRPSADGSPGFGMRIDSAESNEAEAMRHFVALYFSGPPNQGEGYVDEAGDFYRLEVGERSLELLREGRLA